MAKPFLPVPKPSAKAGAKPGRKLGAKPGARPGARSASTPALERREEQLHRDLDHDGERGESAAHRARVFGKSPAKRGLSPKPAAFGGQPATPFGK